MRDHGERTAPVATQHEDGTVTVSRITGRLYGPDGSEPPWREPGPVEDDQRSQYLADGWAEPEQEQR